MSPRCSRYMGTMRNTATGGVGRTTIIRSADSLLNFDRTRPLFPIQHASATAITRPSRFRETCLMLDFDCIDDWAQQLSVVLEDHLPDGIVSTLVGAAPEFIEDARDLLFELTDKDAIIDATLTWIRSTSCPLARRRRVAVQRRRAGAARPAARRGRRRACRGGGRARSPG